jgi:hypothetical protein
MAGFCSHHDAEGRVVFDAQYFPYFWARHLAGDPAALGTLTSCLEIKRAAGMRHVVADLPDGTVYDQDWIQTQPDWSHGDIEPFRAMCRWLVSEGFHPIIVILTGERVDVPKIYDGTLERLTRDLIEFRDLAVWQWGWETVGAIAPIRTKENVDAWTVLDRVLGPTAVIGVHTDSAGPGRMTFASALGPVHDPDGHVLPQPPRSRLKPDDPETWIQDDDPTDGDEAGAWTTPIGRRIAARGVWLHQGPDPFDYDRWLEFVDRALPPGTMIPAVGRAVIGPHWLGAAGLELCAHEPDGIPFEFIRHRKTDADVRAFYARLCTYGTRSCGCLPSAPLASSEGTRV